MDRPWSQPPREAVLRSGEVNVWLGDLNVAPESVAEFERVLSPDERERAGRFRFEKDRAHYIAGRGILRSILGRYLQASPGELRFRYNTHGKPYLADKTQKVQFNVAHSHGLALFAITNGPELGIDIEFVRPDFATAEIAERFFAPEEVQMLAAIEPAGRTMAFFHCWTRKEAFIKARGMGLSLPLNRFVVNFGPDVPCGVLSAQDEPEVSKRWSLYDLQPAEGYAAALAAQTPAMQVRLWRFG
jgi:4'-phosphopantetheinyl transferase